MEWKNLQVCEGAVEPSEARPCFSEYQGGGVVRVFPISPAAPSSPASITVKDVKALLPQVNYRVPNMRFLKDKLQVRHEAPPWML